MRKCREHGDQNDSVAGRRGKDWLSVKLGWAFFCLLLIAPLGYGLTRGVYVGSEVQFVRATNANSVRAAAKAPAHAPVCNRTKMEVREISGQQYARLRPRKEGIGLTH